MKGPWKIDELARHANVTTRTIRYYLQQGLLPAPEFRGKDTAYTDEHFQRLREIQRLQQQAYSLPEIERMLRATAAPVAVDDEQPSAAIGTTSHQKWMHVELADGLSLMLSDDAPLASKRLFEKLERYARKESQKKEIP